MSEYKVDSTRGKALVMPKRYKGDVMIQVWIDSRVLATLSSWLDKEGMMTRFMSDVVRDSLKTFCDYLVDIGEVEMIDDTLLARDVLQSKYRVNLNAGSRGKRNIQHNKVLSEDRMGLRHSIDGRRRVSEIATPMTVTGIPQEERLEMIDGSASRIEDATTRAYKRIREEEVEQRKADHTEAMSKINFDENGRAILGQFTEYIAKENNKPAPIKESHKNSDIPRKKTKEEVDDDVKRIAKKDADEKKEMDRMMDDPPKATA